jgi:hypothetical protein
MRDLCGGYRKDLKPREKHPRGKIKLRPEKQCIGAARYLNFNAMSIPDLAL